jgi:hypothetical protein
MINMNDVQASASKSSSDRLEEAHTEDTEERRAARIA